MSYELKVKNLSLWQEALIIKNEEQREKWKRQKWKAKAISAKARAQAQGKAVDPELPKWASAIQQGLYLHRVNQVRKEARCGLLAYGFLRGNSYREMENFAWTQPNWDRVEKLAVRYSGKTEQEVKQSFSQWRDEALEGVKPVWCESVQPGSIKTIVDTPTYGAHNKDWVEMQLRRNPPKPTRMTEVELLRGLEDLIGV